MWVYFKFFLRSSINEIYFPQNATKHCHNGNPSSTCAWRKKPSCDSDMCTLEVLCDSVDTVVSKPWDFNPSVFCFPTVIFCDGLVSILWWHVRSNRVSRYPGWRLLVCERPTDKTKKLEKHASFYTVLRIICCSMWTYNARVRGAEVLGASLLARTMVTPNEWRWEASLVTEKSTSTSSGRERSLGSILFFLSWHGHVLKRRLLLVSYLTVRQWRILNIQYRNKPRQNLSFRYPTYLRFLHRIVSLDGSLSITDTVSPYDLWTATTHNSPQISYEQCYQQCSQQRLHVPPSLYTVVLRRLLSSHPSVVCAHRTTDKRIQGQTDSRTHRPLSPRTAFQPTSIRHQSCSLNVYVVSFSHLKHGFQGILLWQQAWNV